MFEAPLLLAFTAGMVASFNPCGFSLLPAYVGVYVSGENPSDRVERRLIRAVGVAMSVSVGFVAVFSTTGLILDQISGAARRQLPWITIVIGGLLVLAGIAVAFGWKPRIGVRGPQLGGKGTGFGSMVGYGVTYAVASLSCTIGPFLAVTGAALNQSTAGGLATYIFYALGMGVIILAISVATAVTQTAVIGNLRRFSRWAPKIGGVLMVIAGFYSIWYGRWELAVYSGDLGTDPIIDAGENIRTSIINVLESIGAVRVTLMVLILSVLAYAILKMLPTRAPVEKNEDANV